MYDFEHTRLKVLFEQHQYDNIICEILRVKQFCKPEDRNIFYYNAWISDCYVLLGQYRKAIEAYPQLLVDERWSAATDKLLSLKLAARERIQGRDILTLFGPQVTSFGRKHLSEIVYYIDVILGAEENKIGRNLIAEWAKICEKAKYYSVFAGLSYGYNESQKVKIPEHLFSYNHAIFDFVKTITRQAENTIREEIGIPNVGEGWVSETLLYYEIKKAFPELEVQHHASPSWLGRQHLDIFFPELKIGLEYQGLQHDEPIEFFGGEQAFQKTRKRDAKKRRLCGKNGVKILYVYPNYILAEVIRKIGELVE